MTSTNMNALCQYKQPAVNTKKEVLEDATYMEVNGCVRACEATVTKATRIQYISRDLNASHPHEIDVM